MAWPHYELLLRTETSSELKKLENRCVKNCWTLGELYDRVHQMTIPDNGPAADLGTLILRLGNIAVPLTISSRIASKPLPGAYPDRMCIMIHSG